MKKFLVSVVSIICILSLTTVTFAATISGLKDQLEDNKTKINELEGQVDEIELEQKDLLSQIEILNSQINKLEKEIKTLNSKILECDAQIKAKQKELEAKQKELEEKNELLRTRIAVMYEMGNISVLDVLLGSESIADFLSKYYIISEITKFDKNLMDEVVKEKEEIEGIKVTLETKKKEIQEDKAVVQTKSTKLSSSKLVLNKKNNELETNKTALNKSIDKIIEESNKITSEIMRLQGNSEYAGGVMAWPLPGFKTITSPYGMRKHPTLGVYKLHTGVDIAGSGCNKKPIVAANTGKVIKATYNTAYGNMIIIDHGGGISTLYGHASKLLVSVGDVVTRGQTIAYVGTTGYSTGPHLHFEVRINGSTTDPMPYIK